MDSWSEKEVEIIVLDYFDMLRSELLGIDYNKTAHRRSIMPSLDGRSHGSIELKHQNISALLIELGLPYISGYKPRRNYQRKLLPDAVLNYLIAHPDIESLISRDVEIVPEAPDVKSILHSLVNPPEPSNREVQDSAPTYRAVARNYLEAEASNRQLGRAGEEFVINFEKARLIFEGRESLSERIEHTSFERGDGAGFDIRSFNQNGSDRFIEAKTTKYGKETPFYISKNEVHFSEKQQNNYYLYRVFDFRRAPRLYLRQGSVSKTFTLDPISFSATP